MTTHPGHRLGPATITGPVLVHRPGSATITVLGPGPGLVPGHRLGPATVAVTAPGLRPVTTSPGHRVDRVAATIPGRRAGPTTTSTSASGRDPGPVTTSPGRHVEPVAVTAPGRHVEPGFRRSRPLGLRGV
ncbi:hypothetical protein ACFVU0_24325 [Streptomyces sp. NPDC058122]|uniref:hypothetical protein n=1 Tax=Streptomyces sp. NPDC058122 TaxID=3346349 RepID=UPI0036F1591F